MIIITGDVSHFDQLRLFSFMKADRERRNATSAHNALLLCVGAICAGGAAAADICPNPLIQPDPRLAAPRHIDPNAPIDASADRTHYAENGDVQLQGNVEVKQGERSLRADGIDYTAASGTLKVPGAVELRDPQLVLRGSRATVATEGDAEFSDTQFELPARAGRGSATQIVLSRDGELTLRDTHYTTCPAPSPSSSPDWELKVNKLHIDADARIGTATNASVEFKGVPIFYTPYISFPVGNERKSGLLLPTPGQSARGGFELSLPWYWNIAPNYDATITPTWYSKRGLDLGSEFRFLTERHRGELNGNFLPNDQDADGSDRSFVELHTRSDFNERWRLDTGGANVGDVRWFEDFGSGEYISSTVVPRWAELRYRDRFWSALARAQNYQVIDREIPVEQRPYTVLPQVAVRGYFPDQPLGFTAALEADYAAFTRNNQLPDDLTGHRYSVSPQLHLPLRGDSLYLEPAAKWHYLGYRLKRERSTDMDADFDRQPSVAVPEFSVDSGMIFERSSGRSQQRIQTLEPRLAYLYVPYRNQDDMPVFDTGRPDLNLIQLFRNQRYVGGDRIGDANQLAVGVTSRLLDANDGRQYIAATVGQMVRFETPRISLANDIADPRDTSDLIGELSITAYRNWNAQIGYQWDPHTQRTERTEFAFQYQPGPGKVINVGYRFRNPITNARGLEQADASFAWPIGASFSAYALAIYSLQDHAATEQFAGLEYRSCCWNMRLVAGRSLVTRSGEYDTWYKWQLELKGLSSVGNGDAFLSQMIRGYSAARFDINSTP